MPPRVLLAGLFHETHTFLESETSLADFTVRRGHALLDARGDGSPLAGILDVAESAGWELLPAIDLRATPGAICADAVYDEFVRACDAAVDRAGPGGIDAVALVLHGAMVCRSRPDVEGDLIAHLRSRPELARVPIGGVLDLHGNLSARSIEGTDAFVAYRENPHVDACEAARDGARLLDRVLRAERRPVSLAARAGIVWPPTGTGTADDPMRALESAARQIERTEPGVACVNVFGGYSFADTPDTGVSFSAVTFGDPDAARRRLDGLVALARSLRESGTPREPTLDEVLPLVKDHVNRGVGPVLLVEPADNIGGGAPGDGTSVLRALLREGITGGGVALHDPQSVARLEGLAPGSRARLALGGKGSRLTDGPVEAEVELVSRSDGRFALEDPHSHLASMVGRNVDMGPCAVVRTGGTTVLLTSRRTPPFDLGQWRSQGIDPEKLTVIGVKAAVAHRRAYDPIARASWTVSVPGPCTSDVRSLPYRLLRRPCWPWDAGVEC